MGQGACLIYDACIMAITDHSKEKLKARLARAMGHLNAVHTMVDQKRYCIDVLHQLKAVQAALDKTAEEILRQHLETCVVEAMRNPGENNMNEQRVIDELMQVFKKAPNLYDTDVSIATPSVTVTSPTSPPGKSDCCH